jgi:hypothetical protein
MTYVGKVGELFLPKTSCFVSNYFEGRVIDVILEK